MGSEARGQSAVAQRDNHGGVFGRIVDVRGAAGGLKALHNPFAQAVLYGGDHEGNAAEIGHISALKRVFLQEFRLVRRVIFVQKPVGHAEVDRILVGGVGLDIGISPLDIGAYGKVQLVFLNQALQLVVGAFDGADQYFGVKRIVFFQHLGQIRVAPGRGYPDGDQAGIAVAKVGKHGQKSFFIGKDGFRIL